MQRSLPVAERPRRPEWMKVRAPSANTQYFDVRKLIHGASLHTICEEARCPNIAECWGRGTATFQILGDTCTRACRYCYVNSGKPDGPPDPLEPLRLAQTAAQMRLKHVVVTSVDRDDLPDRGSGHYAATIRALKRKVPTASVEVLTPDFLGVEEEALRTVLAERPEVFNHNIETVRRLHKRMRGAKVEYDKALWLLRRAKELADYDVMTKSGIIVGLGETNDEVVETMRDLRENGVDVVTIGQYLQPSPKHAKIDRWVHPDEFRWFREQGEALGFGSVFSGPLVRSSYRADEQRHAATSGRCRRRSADDRRSRSDRGHRGAQRPIRRRGQEGEAPTDGRAAAANSGHSVRARRARHRDGQARARQEDEAAGHGRPRRRLRRQLRQREHVQRIPCGSGRERRQPRFALLPVLVLRLRLLGGPGEIRR
jgi:lipoyl synthase